ncbi:TPA: type II toxin-antitoxin system HicB family antitoxin [Escherichia coli]
MKYPVYFENRGFWYSFTPDIPYHISWGHTKKEAEINILKDIIDISQDCFRKGKIIPLPSRVENDFINISPTITAKILMLNEILKKGAIKSKLAESIMVSPQEFSRIVNLNHKTKIDTIEKVLFCMGKRLKIDLEDY